MAGDKLRIEIDENDLATEWQNQASAVLHYNTLLAGAVHDYDIARARLGVVVAELDRDIRDAPEDYGLPKATDAIMSNAIAGQPEHQIALKKVNEAKHRVGVLRAACDALEHRKRSLQGMTDLWLRQWYSDPTTRDEPTPNTPGGGKGGDGAKRNERRRRRRTGAEE